MNTSIRRSLVRLAILLALTSASGLPSGHAQQKTEPAPAASAEEKPIELPPFEVRTDKDEGYVAQNTTSGSRLNTSLKDTAAPVSVFTQEFLFDIGATDIATLADYTVNTERVNGIVGDVANGNEFSGATVELRVRGLPSSRMVNFFPRSGEVDTFNSERVELSRGPNALLFGLGGAGGAFNNTTKKADLRRASRSATFRFGDYEAMRTSIDVNQAIVPGKFALRINALDARKNSWRPHEYNDARRLALAGRWQVSPKIVLNAEYEMSNTNRATHRAWAGFDSFTTWKNAGRLLDPKVAAPGQTLAQTRTALGIAASAVSTATTTSHSWVWNASDGQVINYAGALAANVQSRSANTSAPVTPGAPNPGSGPQENPMLLDFSVVPREVAIGGSGIGNLGDQDVFTTGLTVEPLKRLFFDLAFNREELRSTGYDIGNTELRVQWDTSPTTITGTPNPRAGQAFIEILPNQRNQKILSDDLRLTSSYEIALRKTFGRHRLGALLERRTEQTATLNMLRKIVVNPPNTASADNASNSLRYRTYVDLKGPVGNIASANFRNDPSGRSAWIVGNAATNVKRITDTMMVATQSYFWNDRIVATVGYRDDELKNYDSVAVRGPAYGPFAQGDLVGVRNATPLKKGGITRTQGVVVHATPWASGFFNTSSSFNLANPNNRLARNAQAPNAQGVSDDVGVKISLLGGRIFATVTHYKTAAQHDTANLNQGVSSGGINAIWDALNTTVLPGRTRTILAENNINIDNVRTDFNAYTLDTSAQGWEYEVVANPTSAWRVSFSLADRKASQRNTAPELLAYIDQYRPLWNANADVVTAGAGALTVGGQLANIDADHLIRIVRPNGLQKVGDARYSASLRSNYAFREGWLRGFSLGGGGRWRGTTLVGYSAALQPLEVGGYTLIDANLGYRTKAGVFGKKLDLSFQLNVNNLFNEDDLIPTRLFDDGRLRTYRFQSARDWFLTTTARF
ncbi:MAG: hypothetical protein Q8N18_12125 [Opitutaceae bacterium]|nr:hypothetical protein [Opitutaceae bacterium]